MSDINDKSTMDFVNWQQTRDHAASIIFYREDGTEIEVAVPSVALAQRISDAVEAALETWEGWC